MDISFNEKYYKAGVLGFKAAMELEVMGVPGYVIDKELLKDILCKVEKRLVESWGGTGEL